MGQFPFTKECSSNMRVCRPLNLALEGYAYKDRMHFSEFFESNFFN